MSNFLNRRNFIARVFELFAISLLSSFSPFKKAYAFSGARLRRARKTVLVVTGLYTFGNNEDGQLGDSSTTNRSSPIRIGGVTSWLSIETSKDLSSGFSSWHSAAVRGDGKLWMWGKNINYQLGNGNTTDRSIPIQIATAITDWKQVATGVNSSTAIRTNGWLYGWGDSTVFDQLGMAGVYSTPVRVGTGTDWQRISMGLFSSIGIRGTGGVGRLWFSGVNGSGEAGFGSTGSSFSTHVQVGSISTWNSVVAGTEHTIAKKVDGTLFASGKNNVGQLGTGAIAAKVAVLTQVAGGATTWASVSTHFNHTLGVGADGSLWAWGANTNGKLGLGDTVTRSTPVQVGALSDWSNISAGLDYSLATKTDGTLWAWGLNTWGNLGTGNTTSYNSPIQVGTGTNWNKLFAGACTALTTRT